MASDHLRHSGVKKQKAFNDFRLSSVLIPVSLRFDEATTYFNGCVYKQTGIR